MPRTIEQIDKEIAILERKLHKIKMDEVRRLELAILELTRFEIESRIRMRLLHMQTMYPMWII